MIKLQIIGNLGKDCIMKEVNGKTVINFSVVHSERYKDNQGVQKERATWVECAYWTDKTGVVPYLTKGKTIYAEGYPEAEAYMNKENQAAATLRMRVMNIQLVGGVGGENTGQNSGGATGNTYAAPTSSPAPVASTTAADDLPF
ncbi:MAG: single-stranded DNA-binding protein [Aquabacterium sp.]|nr:single-stranded DNA-binding protein [Ferruginibacter sp.]